MYVFMFQAALLCEDCGNDTRADLTAKGKAPEDVEDESSYDSDAFPKGPYRDGGGEADTPQHCDSCGVFLDNALTGDGENYVRDAFLDYIDCESGRFDVLREWRHAYDYVFDDHLQTSLECRREEKPLSARQEARLAILEAA